MGSLYVHVPFCKKRCHYCDFPIRTLPKGGRREELVRAYVSAVLAELRASCEFPEFSGPLETLFFGGGTPSLLPLDALETLLAEIDARVGISPGAEISIEADPGTFDSSRLASLSAMGVTRVSVGVQAFQEELLATLGRAHSLKEAEEALAAVSTSGLTWSADLMSGVPHLTPQKWRESLSRLMGFEPHHVSVYDLQVEQGTAFARWFTPGVHPLPSHDEAAEMYRDASEVLRSSGYRHYEVSNFAKPGNECRHNLAYWKNLDWLALGNGAASSVGGAKLNRPSQFNSYLEWALNLEPGDSRLLPEDAPSETDRALDEVMLRLRLEEGIDLDSFSRRFGERQAEAVACALEGFPHGLASVEREGRTGAPLRARLIQPDGFLCSNDAIAECFAALT